MKILNITNSHLILNSLFVICICMGRHHLGWPAGREEEFFSQVTAVVFLARQTVTDKKGCSFDSRKYYYVVPKASGTSLVTFFCSVQDDVTFTPYKYDVILNGATQNGTYYLHCASHRTRALSSRTTSMISA